MRQRIRNEAATRRAASVDRVERDLSETVVLAADDSVVLNRHRLECDIRNRLMSDERLNFASLVVRRIADGVMLEGVLETDDGTDVASLVRRIAGVDRVLNCLVVRQPQRPPRKG